MDEAREGSGARGPPMGLIQAGQKCCLTSRFQECRSMQCCEVKRAWDSEPGGLGLSAGTTNANSMSSCELFNFSDLWISLRLFGLNESLKNRCKYAL